MDKGQAKQIIIQTFEHAFDEEKFAKFLRNILKSFQDKWFKYQGNYIPDAFESYISSLERIGKYTDPKGREIDLLIVRLKKGTTLERARTTQRNFIAWYLNGSRGGKLKDAALVAFVAPDSKDWRFSLVKMEYGLEETSGKIRVEKKFTPAKRWSFLVGENEKSHTAQSRFIPLLERDEPPTLEELEEAFDVEVVTKEFFKEYRNLFIRTKLKLDDILKTNPRVREEFDRKGINTVDFAKKLLGQITFLYFLQKKGWFGVEKGKPWGTGSRIFLRELFNKKYGDYENFFNDVLEPLFYEALATDRSSFDHYYSRFNCKLPFLNGGLFDPINGYDWVNVDILLPNALFSNTNRTKEGDIGDGILDVLDRYNFTVNEEEPLEKEVALDPELLGKIYEKLNAIRADNFDEYVRILGSKRKERETQFNREYGVYYTPKEIVHYMCQESLKNYLVAELSSRLPEEEAERLRKDIEEFVKMGDSILEEEKTALERKEPIRKREIKSTKYKSRLPEYVRKYAKQIDDLLADIRICDPAVGSGAFPIGMMHEIVKLRMVLAPHLGENRKPYDLKRHCIENSLYGVDIDAGAVEICKLRFWLSLIVDEEDFYNIKPLPNLEYKVVCGDSLKSIKRELFDNEAFGRLEELKVKYFNETNLNKKQELKGEIERLLEQITEGHKEFDFRVYFSEVFQEKEGFDVVIANPPYVQLQKDRGKLANLYKDLKFKTFDRRGDIYTLFYEKGMEILREGGHLCFISSNKWMRAGYGEKLRKFFMGYNPKLLIDLGPGIFESATVDTCIFLIQKKNMRRSFKLRASTLQRENDKPLDIASQVERNSVLLEKLWQGPWFIGGDAEQRLKEKIERIGKPLKGWDVKIFYGIKTGLNEAFIIDSKKREEILRNCKDEKERQRTEAIIKPILRGRDIKRYYHEWAGLWVIIAKFGSHKVLPTEYPAIYSHLKQYEKKLKNRGQCKYSRNQQNKIDSEFPGQHHWLELDNNPKDEYLAEFEKEKVVYSEIVREPQFYYDKEKFYIEATGFLMTGKNVKYICGLLNSKPVTFFFKQWYAGGGLSQEGYRYKKAFLENLPLPPITSSNEGIVKQIEELVDRILSAKRENPEADTTELERQIDRLVYQLYHLTEEEIKIIEKAP